MPALGNIEEPDRVVVINLKQDIVGEVYAKGAPTSQRRDHRLGIVKMFVANLELLDFEH